MGAGSLGPHTHHIEDGVDNDINGDGGGPPPVPHWPHALPVVGHQVVRQPQQGGPGVVLGLGGPPLPGWEGEQFKVKTRALKPSLVLLPWFVSSWKECVPTSRNSQIPTTD